MVVYQLVFSQKWEKDIQKHRKSGQVKLLAKIFTFLEEIEQTPTTGTGQVEALKGFEQRQVYSRRIDKKHRLIYEVFEEDKQVEILSAYGHYED
ncbi:Txe/YoeB family addiction module toxin [Capnocytophaga sp.]|uniref:Txe/YoeB family addiction module toxin n=1 Tax=Capnocytophaga sp. TaxID=44737 RepID=UPI0026DB3C55|nr:Txe/YoeB family addiction module toxin [Capnocytophaga sp.]MDO5105604.1 Txe/YoeB family addiction module toxin [Capnocytophaga sp.]